MKNLLKYRISYRCEKLMVIRKSCLELIFFTNVTFCCFIFEFELDLFIFELSLSDVNSYQ